MARHKCVCCGEWIEADEASVPYKNRYAHKRCFDVAVAALRNNKQKKLQEQSEGKSKKSGTSVTPKMNVLREGLSEEEYQKKKKYYNYLQSLTEDEIITVKARALTEDYIKRYKFTYESMRQTLVYLNEVKQKALVGDVVGIIPFYHDEAQRFYSDVEEREKTAEAKGKIVYSQRVLQANVHRNINQIDRRKQIDIDEIESQVTEGWGTENQIAEHQITENQAMERAV